LHKDKFEEQIAQENALRKSNILLTSSKPLKKEEFIEAQKSDAYLKYIADRMIDRKRTPYEATEEGLIFHRDKLTGKRRLAIPKSLVELLINQDHEKVLADYLKSTPTKERLRHKYHYPKYLEEKIEEICQKPKKEEVVVDINKRTDKGFNVWERCPPCILPPRSSEQTTSSTTARSRPHTPAPRTITPPRTEHFTPQAIEDSDKDWQTFLNYIKNEPSESDVVREPTPDYEGYFEKIEQTIKEAREAQLTRDSGSPGTMETEGAVGGNTQVEGYIAYDENGEEFRVMPDTPSGYNRTQEEKFYDDPDYKLPKRKQMEIPETDRVLRSRPPSAMSTPSDENQKAPPSLTTDHLPSPIFRSKTRKYYVRNPLFALWKERQGEQSEPTEKTEKTEKTENTEQPRKRKKGKRGKSLE
jgi:hypothetical protein